MLFYFQGFFFKTYFEFVVIKNQCEICNCNCYFQSRAEFLTLNERKQALDQVSMLAQFTIGTKVNHFIYRSIIPRNKLRINQ